MKKISIVCLILLTTALCACESDDSVIILNSDENNSISEEATTESVETTTTLLPITENETFTLINNSLPTNFQDINIIEKEISEFCGGNVAIDEEYIYFEELENVQSDEIDYSYFAYNLKTGDITEFDGTLPKLNSTLGMYAFAEGKLYSVYQSFDTRYHYCVDPDEKIAEIITSEPVRWYEDSFYFTYPVNEKQYAEAWFEIGEGNINTEHIILYDSDGDGKEIFSNTYNREKQRAWYDVNDNKIYEYMADVENPQPKLTVYDIEGNMLSEYPLNEIADELQKYGNEEGAIEVYEVKAAGDYCIVKIRDWSTYRSYIYNLKLGTVVKHDDLHYISPYKSVGTDAEKHLFLRYNDSSDIKELYTLDNNGNFTALASVSSSEYCNFLTNGEQAAYVIDGVIYRIDL